MRDSQFQPGQRRVVRTWRNGRISGEMPHFVSVPRKTRFVKVFRCAIIIFLEGCLPHAGDLALIGQLTEADTADAVVPEVSMRAAAQLAAVILAGGELGRTGLLDLHRSLCHCCLPP